MKAGRYIPVINPNALAVFRQRVPAAAQLHISELYLEDAGLLS